MNLATPDGHRGPFLKFPVVFPVRRQFGRAGLVIRRREIGECGHRVRDLTAVYGLFKQFGGSFQRSAHASGPMTITIYGIKNCDTMKKARAWLDQRGIDCAFHDYKTAGIERARLERWCKLVGWEALLNRAGTTFRKLAETDRDNVDARKAVALMLAQPSMIRRPVLELGGGELLVGFKPEVYGAALTARN
jgi:arsenate reductase (glutaredoxin)